MLWLDPSSLGFSIADLAARAKTRGITLGSNRIVVHHQITREACEDLVALVAELKDEYKDRPKKEIDQEQNRLYAEGVYSRPIEPPIARLGTSYGKVRPVVPLRFVSACSWLTRFSSRPTEPVDASCFPYTPAYPPFDSPFALLRPSASLALSSPGTAS